MKLKSVDTGHPAKRRRSFALGLSGVVCLAVALSLISLALATTSFPDVPHTHDYHAAIRELAGKGIIGGYENGNFGPDDPVRRQQFAKMIVLTGVDLGKYTVSEDDVCPFKDVEIGGYTDPFFPDNYVAVCAAKRITLGTTPTTFDPWNFITRYQVISMVVRAIKDMQPGLLETPPADFAATAGWGNDPVHGTNAALAEHNLLLLGFDLENLNPYENMTRGEVAHMLHNLIGKMTYWSNTPRIVYYLGLNTQHPGLDDPHVRQALALAVDRQAISAALDDASAVPATGWVPPSIPGYAAITHDFLKPTAQVAQAAVLLANAGHAGGAGLPEIKIQVTPSGQNIAVANAVKTQWQAIGVNAAVVEVPFGDYWALLQSDDVMVFRMGYIADFNDAYEFFNLFRADTGGNFTRWSNPDYDQILDQSLLTATDEERWALYSALEKTLCVDELPVIPLYWK